MSWLGCCARLDAMCLRRLRSWIHAPRAGAEIIPSKNITIVVSIGAGTGMDVLVRLYAEKLSAALGKPVVVENKPGAATMLAADAVATAPPDGHTLVVLTSAAHGDQSSRSTSRSTTDPENDFVPISLYVKSPFILVVNPNLPFKTVPEFIKYAKEVKPPLNYATRRRRRPAAPVDGVRQAAVRLRRDPRALPQHRQSVTDLAAGHVDVGFVEAGASMPLIKEGQAARARGVVLAAAAAAAGRAAVLGGRQRAGFRGRVLAHPAGAGEDAEGHRRYACTPR